MEVGLRELSHHTSRVIARVKSGEQLDVTERGRVIARLVPVSDRIPPPEEWQRPRPRIGGYRSEQPLTSEEIDAALAEGFGSS